MGLSLTRVRYVEKDTLHIGFDYDEVLEKLLFVNEGVTVYTLDRERFEGTLSKLSLEEKEEAKHLIDWMRGLLKRSDIVDIIVG